MWLLYQFIISKHDNINEILRRSNILKDNFLNYKTKLIFLKKVNF